jgi:L-ribulose-5-phosphate 3-epimerase
MSSNLTRRNFIATGTAALSLAALIPEVVRAAKPVVSGRKVKRAIMWATVRLKGTIMDKMKAIKSAGFEGVEIISHLNQQEVLQARDETGLEISSVCGEHHWQKPLSHSEPNIRAEGLAALKQTLGDAKAYGASSILLVPGLVNSAVTFDQCWQRSIEQIRQAIPLAEELGIKISIENVWNDFITTEDQAARYLDEINSPWVCWHFDCGNVIRYGDPIAWIKKLGKRITRVHIKEYSRDLAMRKADVWAGFQPRLLEGANNWAGIMSALREVGYDDYFITEQEGGNTLEGLKDLVRRLDKIMAM